MDYRIIQPPQQLANYVRFFWFLERNDKPFIHRAFAYPCPEIIFCYKDEFKYSCGFESEKIVTCRIFGQTQAFSMVTSKAGLGVFGFYLYPHAIPQLFCLPANELTNQSVDIKTLCGKEGEILEEKMMLAKTNTQRLKLVSDFLQTRLKNVKSEYTNIFSTIKSISSSNPGVSVKALADNNFCNYSA